MVAYVLLGIGMIASGSSLMMHIGGYAGLVSSVLAFYTGGAMVINSAGARPLLPLGGSLDTPMETSMSRPVAPPPGTTVPDLA